MAPSSPIRVPGEPVRKAAPSADLVDGVYQPESHQWNLDSIWWNGYTQPTNSITIALAGTYAITDFSVQADDNDTYLLEYFGTDLAWHNAWDISTAGSYGLTTRTDILGALHRREPAALHRYRWRRLLRGL